MEELFRTPRDPVDERTGVVWRRRRADGVKIPTLRVVAGPDLLASYAIYAAERVRDRPRRRMRPGPFGRLGLPAPCRGAMGRRQAAARGSRFYHGTALGRVAVRGRVMLPLGQVFYVGNVALRIDAMTSEEIRHLERVTERLTQLARDPLTGLLGRGWLEEELPGLVERAQQRQTELAALFVDVDHFKNINDTFGHAVGDQVLRVVAHLMVSAVRETDKVVRYGGEEFVVILDGCEEGGAEQVAERLRRAIERHRWSSYVVEAEITLVVTASIGIATLGQRESPGMWLDRADKAMYAAKQAGRNRVRGSRSSPLAP